MNSPSQPSLVIRPETVAAKLAAHRDFAAPDFAGAVKAEPRLIELLWFIQSQSLQPGGLPKFTEQLLEKSSARLGTNAMHRIGKTNQPYTAVERMEVLDSFPYRYDLTRRGAECELETIISDFMAETRGDLGPGGGRGNPNLAFLSRQNHPYFLDYCRRCMAALLPAALAEFCSQPDTVLPDPVFFDGLQSALIQAMGVRAAQAGEGLAMTEVTTAVFDALDFAWNEKTLVEIIGDSRFGKTESAKAWCQAHPGRARLVKTPCDNADRSLYEAIAESVGMEVTLKTTFAQLKYGVQYVLRHGGLLFVFDEAHWLIPQRYGARTAPMRLNFLRSQMLDNGCPVALLKTPQRFNTAAQSFEQTTGYNMAQWTGRVGRRVELPHELPGADLLSVVNKQAPGLPDVLKRRVVGAALQDESYLAAVESVVKNARAEARKHGRQTITQEDLDAGIRLAGIIAPAAKSVLTPPAIRQTPHGAAPRSGVRQVTPAPAPALALPARNRGARPIQTTPEYEIV